MKPSESWPRKTTATKIVVFWTNFFLIVLLGRKLVGAPSDSLAFAIQSLFSLVCGLMVTGAILRYWSWKGTKIIVAILWVACSLVIVM